MPNEGKEKSKYIFYVDYNEKSVYVFFNDGTYPIDALPMYDSLKSLYESKKYPVGFKFEYYSSQVRTDAHAALLKEWNMLVNNARIDSRVPLQEVAHKFVLPCKIGISKAQANQYATKWEIICSDENFSSYTYDVFANLSLAFEHCKMLDETRPITFIDKYCLDSREEVIRNLHTEFFKLNAMCNNELYQTIRLKQLKEVVPALPADIDIVAKSLLQQAHDIVHNDSFMKERQYGKFDDMVTRCTEFSRLLLNKPDFTELDFLKVLISLKLGRWSNSEKEDTLVDLLAYIGQYTKTIFGK